MTGANVRPRAQEIESLRVASYCAERLGEDALAGALRVAVARLSRVTVRLEYSGMRAERTSTVLDAPTAVADMFARHGITPTKADPMRGRVRSTGARARVSFVPLD